MSSTTKVRGMGNSLRAGRLARRPASVLARVLDDLSELRAPQPLIAHLKEVAQLSLAIGKGIAANGHDVDLSVVVAGAGLHDVGYLQASGIRHALAGARMVRELGYPESVALIVERHMVGGITAEMIRRASLDLPVRNFVPLSLEEKIVAMADQLVHRRAISNQFLVECPDLNEQVARRILALYEELLPHLLMGEAPLGQRSQPRAWQGPKGRG